MAISDTITSMYENVGNVYDVLELAGADLTNVDKNIENLKQSWEERLLYFLANGTDTLWNNWLPKVNGSGETITLNNTIEAKMDFVYKGNTYQYSTTGKNLINDYDLINRYNIASISDNIITTNALNSNYTVFQPRTKTQEIDLVENTKYYVSFDCRLKSGTYSAKLGASIIDGINGTSYSTGNTAISNPNITSSFQRYSFECTSNITTNSIIGLSIQVQQNLTNAVFEITNIMISTSSDTTYEPYTNGASPNPDYPQDIQVVSGDNSITIANNDNTQSASYPINLGNIELCKIGDYQDKIAKSTGKNLFDVSTITENTYIEENGNTGSSQVTNLSDYIEVKPNASYTLSYDYLTLLNSNQRNFVYYDENKTYISGYIYMPVNKATTITTPNNAKYIRFSYDKNCYEIMINEGTTALPYEPYGKVWYLNKQIGKVVLDGSESDWHTSSLSVTGYKSYYVESSIRINQDKTGKCNYFEYKTFNEWQSLLQATFIENSYQAIGIRVVETLAPTLEDFKTWLSTHNTIVYYVLATPTITEITDTTLISQLEAIKKSYNTQTNISQTNDDKPFILDVVALGELD